MICSEPEFCPWCTCRAPHTHFCRSGLTQSVQHCDTAVRSQKIIYGQKTCAFLCSPCWIWKSRKPSRLERCRFPSWSGSLAGHGRPLVERARCFPQSAPAAAERAVPQLCMWQRLGIVQHRVTVPQQGLAHTCKGWLRQARCKGFPADTSLPSILFSGVVR